MADDLGPGMMRALPRTRRLLGERGATFANAFASYPLCCPARATLLTGQYAHNHGAKGNNARSGGGYRALLDPGRNLAAWLQASGYETAFAGKWLNGFRTPPRAPPGWNQWWGLVGAGGEGLSSYYDYEIFDPSGEARHYGTAASDYQTDALTRDYALPFIEAHQASSQPFFLWLAYHPPHSGLGRDDPAGERCSDGPPGSRAGKQSAIPPPRYATRFARARPPVPPSFDEADVADKPAFVRRKPRLSDEDLERINRDYRCGLAALLALDDAVTAIVHTLRAIGQLERTVLIFTADHGVLAGEHRIKRGKNRPYEEAISTPLLISGPGVAPGLEVAAPVVNADLAPTVLALAQASVPPELARPIDGVSLAPVLAGAPPDDGRVIPIEGRGNTAEARHGFKVRSYVGVRTARYAYTEYRRATFATIEEGIAAPIGAGRVTDRELYDLRGDPFELRSRDRDPAYADARRALAALTARLEQCSGDACAVSESVPGPAGKPE
jgi:N-acetylglucosamine-6-sulfatase